MKRTMAWVEKADTLTLRESELPELSSDEVLIKTNYSAVCGSDMHLYHDRHPFVKAPSTIGHELAGYVQAVGRDVTLVKPGDLVAPEPILVCGKCRECLDGNYHMCEEVSYGYRKGQAGFGTYYICKERWAHKLPEGADPKAAVLVEPLSVAVHGVQKAGDLLGKTVTVMGAGIIGAFAAAVCRIKGASQIILIDTNPYRLKAAAAPLPGCIAVNPAQEDSVALVREQTSGKGCDVVIECTGSPVCIRNAVELVRKMGTIVQLGICSGPVDQYPYAPILSKEITLKGSQGYCFDFEKAISLMLSGQIDVTAYVSHVFPFGQLGQAFDLAAAPSSESMKILISYPQDETHGG